MLSARRVICSRVAVAGPILKGADSQSPTCSFRCCWLLAAFIRRRRLLAYGLFHRYSLCFSSAHCERMSRELAMCTPGIWIPWKVWRSASALRIIAISSSATTSTTASTLSRLRRERRSKGASSSSEDTLVRCGPGDRCRWLSVRQVSTIICSCFGI